MAAAISAASTTQTIPSSATAISAIPPRWQANLGHRSSTQTTRAPRTFRRSPNRNGVSVRQKTASERPDIHFQSLASSVDLDTTHRGCSVGANSAMLVGIQTETPRPTLDQLRRSTPWCWVVCEHCMHRTPVAFVPLIIRWRLDASSDVLRCSARCTRCGRKGAVLQHPSWAGMHVGFEPFPVA
jgi:hypothetical protein